MAKHMSGYRPWKYNFAQQRKLVVGAGRVGFPCVKPFQIQIRTQHMPERCSSGAEQQCSSTHQANDPTRRTREEPRTSSTPRCFTTQHHPMPHHAASPHASPRSIIGVLLTVWPTTTDDPRHSPLDTCCSRRGGNTLHSCPAAAVASAACSHTSTPTDTGLVANAWIHSEEALGCLPRSVGVDASSI